MIFTRFREPGHGHPRPGDVRISMFSMVLRDSQAHRLHGLAHRRAPRRRRGGPVGTPRYVSRSYPRASASPRGTPSQARTCSDIRWSKLTSRAVEAGKDALAEPISLASRPPETEDFCERGATCGLPELPRFHAFLSASCAASLAPSAAPWARRWRLFLEKRKGSWRWERLLRWPQAHPDAAPDRPSIRKMTSKEPQSSKLSTLGATIFETVGSGSRHPRDIRHWGPPSSRHSSLGATILDAVDARIPNPSRSWPLLAAPGRFLPLLAAPGRSWFFWPFLAVPGRCWAPSVAPCRPWPLLVAARRGMVPGLLACVKH